MSEYSISKLYASDKRSLSQLERLLAEEGLKKDNNLDYSCVMYDDDYNVIATGSCYKNTLRCFAVSKAHQGEGLLNEIVSHLIQYQNDRGYTELFLYTKPDSAKFFKDLGFYEIARVDDSLVFMENRKAGFEKYLKGLKEESEKGTAIEQIGKASAIVMNANPFSLGHRYLVETAAKKTELVHVFVLSEDSSLIPFDVRRRLVEEGCRDLKNVLIHSSGAYIISNATFPSYFIKSDDAVIRSQAILDSTIFARIAKELNISMRFLGDEPFSRVTAQYNAVLSERLPSFAISCEIIPRITSSVNGVKKVISASTVRQLIKENNFEALKDYLPQSSLNYFLSAEAESVIKKIQNEADVIHY